MALTDWYRDGMISIQDESSMLVAEAVNPEPGMRVLDCAGREECPHGRADEGCGRLLPTTFMLIKAS